MNSDMSIFNHLWEPKHGYKCIQNRSPQLQNYKWSIEPHLFSMECSIL